MSIGWPYFTRAAAQVSTYYRTHNILSRGLKAIDFARFRRCSPLLFISGHYDRIDNYGRLAELSMRLMPLVEYVSRASLRLLTAVTEPD
jgi:hypothetical protein